MGTVYRAVSTETDQIVAIKLLSHEYLDDLGLRTSFEREAKLVTALQHEAIVPIFEFGQDEGQPYLVVQYMPNGSLADRLLQGALSPVDMLPILDRICQAIDYAHEQGIIHRDIKPSNILFDEQNRAYLADFGIAMRAASLHASSPIHGTPAYLSPEQARDEGKIDGRSDIYALGIILYETLTGKLPFDGDLPITIIMQHIHNQAPPLQAADWSLPSELDEVVQRALAKKTADRFPNASELANAYRLALSGQRSDPSTSPQAVLAKAQEEDEVNPVGGTSPGELTIPPDRSSFPRSDKKTLSKQIPAARFKVPEIRRAAGPEGWQLAHLLALGFATLMGFVIAAGLVAFLHSPQRNILFSDGTENFQLLFDRDSFVLINHTPEALDLSDLSFLRASDGSKPPVEYRAASWIQAIGSDQVALQPGECFQLFIPEAADFSLQPGEAPPNIQDCASLQGWLILPDQETWFWIADEGSESFQILLDGEVVQSCTIATGICRFTRTTP